MNFLTLILSVLLAQVAISPLPDVTVTTVATLIKGQNAFRDTLYCTNNSNTVDVRWASSEVTVTAGQRITPGSYIEIRVRGPVFMIAEGSSTSAVISCTEVTK